MAHCGSDLSDPLWVGCEGLCTVSKMSIKDKFIHPFLFFNHDWWFKSLLDSWPVWDPEYFGIYFEALNFFNFLNF